MRKYGIILVLTLLLLSTFVLASAQGNYPDPGESVTNAIVQNMDLTESASLVVNYYAEDGTLAYTNNSVSISPKSVQEIKTQDEPLPSGFTGNAVISSSKPLANVTSIRNSNVPGAPDGFTQGAYNGAAQGASTIYFPSFWAFEFIVSRVTVQNTEDTPAEIQLQFFDRQGNDLGTKTDTLPAHGSKTYCGCNPADWPGGTIPANFEDGSITVTSTNGNLLAGAAVATWGNRSGAYQALTNGDRGTTLYVPSHYRFRAPNVPVGQWTLFSAINIQNTSATEDAPVTIRYYNRSDGQLALTLNATIPPLTTIGANTNNGGDFNASEFEALGADWDGSVTITSDDNVELVGTGVTNWGVDGSAGMFALVAENNAASTLFIPAQYRLDFGQGPQQWSSLNLQNIGTTTVNRADLVIEYIDQNGQTLATFTGNQLPANLGPGAAVGLNTRNGGDLDAGAFNGFNWDFIGGIYVTGPSDADLVATANIIYSNRASVYNAIPGPN